MALIEGTEIKFVESNGTAVSFASSGTVISFATGSGGTSGGDSGDSGTTGKVCICGEYGYHYCPCYGEYVDPDNESGGTESGGTGGTGGTDTSSFTCGNCGQTWTETVLGSDYEYGKCPCCD